MPDFTVDAVAEAICEAIHTLPTWHSLPDEDRTMYRRMGQAAVDVLRPVVSTVEQLDALPVGTVVRDKAGRIFECCGSTGYWNKPGELYVFVSDELHLDAIVLWQPGRDGH